MTSPPGVRIYRVHGSQEAMGFALGEAMRADQARSLASYYRELPRRLILGPGGGNVTERCLAPAIRPLTNWATRRLEAHRPEAYRRRSRAFLHALGEDADASRYVNVMDVFQNLVGLAGQAGMIPDARRVWLGVPAACSTFIAWGAATAEGALLHGRNFDFPGIGVWDAAPTVVFCTPEEGLRYGYVGTAGADVPGVTAFNEAGIVLSAHTRLHRRVRFDGRTIVDLGHAIAQHARCLDDAIRIARSAPVSSTWGLAVSSARERRAVVLETHGRDVAVVEPSTGTPWLTCTNRNRHERTQTDEVLLCSGWAGSSDGRETVLHRDAMRYAGALTVAHVARMLGSHEDPEVPEWERAAGPIPAQACTVQSIVVQPDSGTLLVSAGGASVAHGPWAEVPMAWSSGPERVFGHGSPPPAMHGARGAAYAAWVETTRLCQLASPTDAIAQQLGETLTHQPDDPSYRFMAGGIALRQSRPEQALAHFEAALGGERNPTLRAHQHLWASRAAHLVGRTRDAAQHREAVLATRDPKLDAERLRAANEQRRPMALRTAAQVKIAPELLDVVVP